MSFLFIFSLKLHRRSHVQSMLFSESLCRTTLSQVSSSLQILSNIHCYGEWYCITGDWYCITLKHFSLFLTEFVSVFFNTLSCRIEFSVLPAFHYYFDNGQLLFINMACSHIWVFNKPLRLSLHYLVFCPFDTLSDYGLLNSRLFWTKTLQLFA